jgi:predicted MFS family arabinose efflux permease
LSFLLGRIGTLWGWRSAFILAGILSTAGVVIAWAALPRAHPGLAREPRLVLDIRPVFESRDALVLIFGYAAAIWGSIGLRQWIVVFLAFCAADQAGVSAQAWSILAVGALISFLGVPAGLLGNDLSIRYGLRNIASLVFLLSAFAGGLFETIDPRAAGLRCEVLGNHAEVWFARDSPLEEAGFEPPVPRRRRREVSAG